MNTKTISVLAGAALMAAPGLALAQTAPPAPDARLKSRVTIQQRERPRPMPARGGEVQTEKINRSIRVGSNGEVVVTNLAGDITVTRGGGSEVQIEAVKTARARTQDEAREMLEAVQVEFYERANRAEVKVVYPSQEQGRPHRNHNVSVNYTITAPAGTRVSVRSMSGSIDIKDIKGEISAVTLSGDVRISSGDRIASAKSTSGDVEIVNATADIPLEASSVSGNVTLRQVKAPRIQVSSISGDIVVADVQTERLAAQSMSGTVEFASPFAKGGRYDLGSHAGTIRIVVVGGTGFELDANTFSGSFQADSSLNLKRDDEGAEGRRRVRAVRAIYGDGSARVDVRTFSGNVIVTKK